MDKREQEDLVDKIERLKDLKVRLKEPRSVMAKFRRYKELCRIMGKEDRIVMDIKEMERNLRILEEGRILE